jgi:hypothetical protein
MDYGIQAQTRGEATAKIVSLACSGTKRELGKGGPPGAEHEPWMFSLILDTTKQTLTVDDYQVMSLSGDTRSKNLVIFYASPPPKGEDGGRICKPQSHHWRDDCQPNPRRSRVRGPRRLQASAEAFLRARLVTSIYEAGRFS